MAATSDVAEHAADRLLDAFTRRMPRLEVAESVQPAAELERVLVHRLVDVALGPRLPELATESVPFLRYRLIVVGGASHPLAGARGLSPPMLAGERWLAGPSGAAAAFLGRAGIDPSVLRARRRWPRSRPAGASPS